MSIVNDLASLTASVVRFGRGVSARVTTDQRPAPERLLELYEYEGCPYCRKVREVLCELDLGYFSHPVAHGSAYRDELRQHGGKIQVPYLVDCNTDTRRYESDDIITYINQTYGAGRRAGWTIPVPHVLDDLDAALASLARLGRGTRCRGSTRRRGLEPVTLYNMEGCPYCRKVREALSELDLQHVVRNVPRGSPKRAELKKLGGTEQVPYLIDPNTGKAMYESDNIAAYLHGQYGSG